MKQEIKTDEAPQAIGPYSQGVKVGGFVFVSGQIALDPGKGVLVEGDAGVQAERVLENVRAILRQAGVGMAEVVKTTIFLVDMTDFERVNTVYGRFFRAPFPARSTLAVAGLPKGARVEIEVVARVA